MIGSDQGELFPVEIVFPAARPRRLLGAVDLSRRLGQEHPPTAEQCRAIEHMDADGRLAPYLVVAGAGSGKTETMAARVVWLVANRLVRPERILGLTFTRKAAGELTERVQRRLAQLARSGVLGARAPGLGADEADDAESWLAGTPLISTYHSYAANLFREHALRIGREPSARLLGEAMTWQYAGRVVDVHDGDMSDVDWAPATVVGAVRGLAADLAEHLGSVDELRRHTAELVAVVEAIPGAGSAGRAGKGGKGVYKPTLDFLAAQRRRLQLLPLVEAYDRRKRDTDSLDFGDQVALAARLATEHPEVRATERGRYDIVLLDEYQDTGSAQRTLLTALYGGGHPVTAVGDPCQSIYGWRGASAGNLRRFASDFPQRTGSPSSQVDLTTSFRNGGRILAVANRLSAPLRERGVPVRDLVPGPTRGPDAGEVVHACHVDAVAEAAWMAERIASLVTPDPAVPGSRARYAPRDVAVLTRARSQFERLEEALQAAGIPVEVSGLGGLLSTPEVVEVMATLEAVSDPSAGPALLRLLTGSRWRLGPRDLDALARRARALAAPIEGDPRSAAALPEPAELSGQAELPEPARATSAAAAEDVDARSLVEALDDPGAPAAYSDAGRERLASLRAELRGLRSRADQPLPDLVADIVRTTRLDVEVAARPGREPATARGHLDRFLDVAAQFAEAEETPTVASFLAYLSAAADYERGLDTGRVGVTGDAVQLLTIHGAKGLEWPVVVLPGLTRDVFPSRPRESTDWCTNAKVLPFALRGDVDDLPHLDLDACTDQKEVRDALAAHKAACSARVALEERRLMYVAATRAQDVLICSGYWWDHTNAPRGPSDFLIEVRELCDERGIGMDAGWAEQPPDGAEHPLDRSPRELTWPRDPLAPAARAALQHGAALVRAAAEEQMAEEQTAAGKTAAGKTAGKHAPDAAEEQPTAEQDRDRARTWAEEVDRLVAERQRLAGTTAGTFEVPLPSHLSVSQLVSLRRDPAGLARWLRRPVPLPPAPLARRGTAFHAWLEQRFAAARLLDIDELPGSADDTAMADEDLAMLKDRFLAGRWAARQPVPGGVEVPFETVVAGVVVRGRMDAVFVDDDGTWEVVDWKTGARPTGAEAAAAAVQLAAYRLAWHRLSGAPLERVRAAFCYVRTGETVRPVDLLDADGLAALIRDLPAATGGDTTNADTTNADTTDADTTDVTALRHQSRSTTRAQWSDTASRGAVTARTASGPRLEPRT